MKNRVNLTQIIELLEANKNKNLTDKLINEIISQLNTQSNIKMEKTKIIDGKTYVYCNFHNDYEPAEKFATKTNGKYRSNCRDAEKLIRKFRKIKQKIEQINLKLYRLGQMDKNLENEIISKITFDFISQNDFDFVKIVEELYPKNLYKLIFGM